jgi:hypothetical protein
VRPAGFPSTKALALLKDEGIIHSVIGEGQYVVERRA